MSERRLSFRQNMLFNSIGSVTYLACQWLISVLAVRLGSFESGGILTLSASLTNFFFTLSTFGIRFFQVSDTGRYTPSQYISTRLLTGMTGLGLCILFTLCNVQYTPYQMLCIVLYMIFRLTESLVDTMAAEEQRAWRMDYVGVSFVMRAITSLGSFTVMMLTTHDIALAFLVMSVTSFAVVLLWDWRIVHRLTGFRVKISPRASAPLLKEAIPLVLNAALLTLLSTIPRYYLEYCHGTDVMGIFGSIATPAVVIQAGCSFVYTPLINPLTDHFTQRDGNSFRQTVLRALLFVTAMVAVVILGAAILGRWGLQLLFGEAILPYAGYLIPVLLTCFCSAMIYFFEVPLTVVRRLKQMTCIHIVANILTLILSLLLIPSMGISGVNLVMYICAGGDALAMGVCTFLSIRSIHK